MKHFNKLSLLLTLLFSLTAIAHDFELNGIYYNIKDNKATETILPYMLPLFVSRTHDFMVWTFQNKKKSVLIDTLRKAIAADEDASYEMQKYISEMIETCPDADAREYWKSLKDF